MTYKMKQKLGDRTVVASHISKARFANLQIMKSSDGAKPKHHLNYERNFVKTPH